MKFPKQVGLFLAAILCLCAFLETGAAAGRAGGGKGGGGTGGGNAGGGNGTSGSRGGQSQPPGQGQTQRQQRFTFKDIPINSEFYFDSDTAKAYRWIKLPDNRGSNTVNSAVVDVANDAPVKR